MPPSYAAAGYEVDGAEEKLALRSLSTLVGYEWLLRPNLRPTRSRSRASSPQAPCCQHIYLAECIGRGGCTGAGHIFCPITSLELIQLRLVVASAGSTNYVPA
jgi:hypothetical protein